MRRDDTGNVALFIPDLHGGGAARVLLNLADALVERGCRIELVLCRATGSFAPRLKTAPFSVVELQPSRRWFGHALASDPAASLLALASRLRHFRRFTPLAWLPWLPALERYLLRARPDALLSYKTSANVVALWAARSTRTSTRLVITEHTHLTTDLAAHGWGFIVPIIRRLYPRADARVTCSLGMADDLAQLARIDRDEIINIYNPVVNEAIHAEAEKRPNHPWLQPGAPPVVLGVGRLTRQKDFGTLLRAFALVRAQRRARLVILGDGELRADLEASGRALDIAPDMRLPGFVRNPYGWMAHAAVFASSSAWEGLPSTLVEAMATGCPVVATDCPSGSAEILERGAYGRLVPVGDCKALADAIAATLDEPPPRERLQRRAQRFTADRAADEYLDVLLADRRARPA